MSLVVRFSNLCPNTRAYFLIASPFVIEVTLTKDRKVPCCSSDPINRNKQGAVKHHQQLSLLEHFSPT